MHSFLFKNQRWLAKRKSLCPKRLGVSSRPTVSLHSHCIAETVPSVSIAVDAFLNKLPDESNLTARAMAN